MTACMNYYRAFQAYGHAGDKAKWIDANPQLFEIVTNVWKYRKELGIPWH